MPNNHLLAIVGASVNPEVLINMGKDGIISVYTVSGSSLDVAMWLQIFGFPSLLVGLVGEDEEGERINDYLAKESLEYLLFPFRGRTPFASIDFTKGFPPRFYSSKPSYSISEESLRVMRTAVCARVRESQDLLRIATGVYPEDIPVVENVIFAGAGVKILSPRRAFFEMDNRQRRDELLKKPQMLFASRADIAPFFKKDGETPAIGENELLELRNAFPNLITIVITCDSAGAYILDGEVLIYQGPAEGINVVDATGAGDAFLAGYLIGYLTGCKPTIKAAIAAKLAAVACSKQGAKPQIADKEMREILHLTKSSNAQL